MSRLFSLVALALASFCCAVAADPPRPLPVAPPPHLPGKITEELPDIGLDPRIEASLPEIGRIDPKMILPPSLTDPTGTVGQPGATGAGAGKDEKTLPGAFAGRTGAHKAKLLKDGGVNAASEIAVARGLAWLAKQQTDGGGWKFDAGKTEERTCATGLALLPFLGAGVTHKKPKDEFKDFKNYDKVVARGLDFLKEKCPLAGADAGRLSQDVYANAIAALPLVEAYAMTGDAALKPVAQAAVNFIQKTQCANGSWSYGNIPQTIGDTSIVGWQLQVLFAAKQAKGLVVDDKVVKKAMAFLDRVAAGEKKSKYGYQDNAGAQPGTALTAIGLLSQHRLGGWGPAHPGFVDGVAGLLKNPPPARGDANNLYYFFYATQVLHGRGGDDWQTWNEGPKAAADAPRKGGLRDWLAGAQRKDGNNAGSWDPEAGWFGRECGRLGTTAVAVLTLEVPYRTAPLYKTDGTPIKADDKK